MDDPVKKAICLFLADDLVECMKICQQCRILYNKQRNQKHKERQLLSNDIVKIYVIELSCLIEIMRGEDLSEKERTIYIKKSHDILEEIPILVKNKEQHHLTII